MRFGCPRQDFQISSFVFSLWIINEFEKEEWNAMDNTRYVEENRWDLRKTKDHPGADLGGECRGCAPSPPEMTCGFLIQLVFCKKKTMWFIGVELEQETSAPPPEKNPGSAPATCLVKSPPADWLGVEEKCSQTPLIFRQNVRKGFSQGQRKLSVIKWCPYQSLFL